MKAMVALMRKLLANVLAVVRRDSPWEEEPPKPKAQRAAPPAPETPEKTPPENPNP
jgi:hypothetical protein